jgi:serpin B
MRQHNDQIGWWFVGVVSVFVLVGLLTTSCGSDGTTDIVPADGAEARSDLDRDESPDVSDEILAQLATDNRDFASDLYSTIREEDGNLIFSPNSISVAFAMTYAGARGMTEEEMAEVLRWTLSQADLHPAFNGLDIELASRGAEASPDPGSSGEEGDRLQLRIANSIWGQEDFEFMEQFLDTLAVNYGAGLRLVDFAGAPEPSRQAINEWVSDETEERIKDLIPAGAIDEMTRLVLANAIYFNASWLTKFDEKLTSDGPFRLLDDSDVTVPMMESSGLRTNYAEVDGVQAVELPYFGGDASFVILLPNEGEFESFDESLTGETIDSILSQFSEFDVNLTMPKFEFESDVGLKEALMSLGMELAFDKDAADFTGIADSSSVNNLYISDAVHKAFISVDEEGTEAAAATAVIVGDMSGAPPAELIADRPFVFLIRDIPTDTILFMGRVVDPSN